MGVCASCATNNHVGYITDDDDDDYVERITHITADIHERIKRKVCSTKISPCYTF